ncbi:MAG: hypothetical protein ACLRQU_11940 [Clostridium sp.]
MKKATSFVSDFTFLSNCVILITTHGDKDGIRLWQGYDKTIFPV